MNVVLVHGFLGSSMNWAPVIQRLNRELNGSRSDSDPEWNFFAPDMLGHGLKSRTLLPTLNLDLVAEDLLREVPEGPFIGVGHSFGLRPLLRIAAQFPHRMPLLVVEDSSPLISEKGFGELMSIFDRVPVPFDTRAEAKEGLEKIFGIDSKMSRFLMTNIRETSPGVHTWRFESQKLRDLLEESYQFPLWKEWSDFEGTVHMILGSEGSYVPPDRLKLCLEQRAGKLTRVVQIPQSGHWVHADQPELFCSELVKVLRLFG